MEPGCRGQKVSFCTTFFTLYYVCTAPPCMYIQSPHIYTIHSTTVNTSTSKYYFISNFLSASNSMSREFCTKIHILLQPCDHTSYYQKTKMWETFLRKVHKSTLSEQKNTINSIPWVSSYTYKLSKLSPLKATYALFFKLRNQARRTIKIGIRETSYSNLFDSGY